VNPVLRVALAGTASLLEEFAAKAKEPPGDGYRERTIEVAVWDMCDAGGESVDAFDLDDGEAEAIAQMIRAQLKQRFGWIPVTERLPDDDMSVMIALRDDADDVWIGWHDGDMGWVCDNGPLGERVTHWMPLPEGPSTTERS
jgi:hypothetical protein